MGLNCTNICALCKFNSLTERQRERKTRSTCFSQDEEIVRLFSEDGHLSLNIVSSGKRIVSERKEKALWKGASFQLCSILSIYRNISVTTVRRIVPFKIRPQELFPIGVKSHESKPAAAFVIVL